MRTLLLTALIAVCSLGPAVAQQPIPMSPELSKFMVTPEEERMVKAYGQNDWKTIVPDCATPSLAGVNVLVHVPPKFDGAGRPISGLWQVVSRVQGCGQTKVFNLFYSVANGKLTRLATLPGTTAADPVLQRDGLMYARLAMARLVTADCQSFQYIDTVFEAFGTAAAGAQGRPWTEKWTVRACGVKGVVRLYFTPDATGTLITSKIDETVRIQ